MACSRVAMLRVAILALLIGAMVCAGGCRRGAAAPGKPSSEAASAGGERLPPERARGAAPAERSSDPGATPERTQGADDPEPGARPARSDTAPPSSARPSMALRRARRACDVEDGAAAVPASPPESPFGYRRPVCGCFAGQVYLLPQETQALPEKYDGLEEGPVLYSCEWNVSPRDLRESFEGIDGRSEWFAIRYEGTFRVIESGTYEFRVSSDDGSRLTIDGETVVDNDGLHAPHSETGDIELAAGLHSLVLEYFQGPPYRVSLQVWVAPPGGEEGLVSVRWD